MEHVKTLSWKTLLRTKNIPLTYCKYKKVLSEDHLKSVIFNFHPTIQLIIHEILKYTEGLFEKYDHCYLDVKVRDLKAGDSGDDLNQVHLDWTNDLNHPNKEETHFLYTSTGGTKFYTYNEFIGETLPNSIYKYHREYHQSPRVKSACKRVMVRLSFVDTLN